MKIWQNLSIKRRILVLALGAVSLVWLMAAAFTYHEAKHELNEVLDAHLAQATALLVAQAAHELMEIETEHGLLPQKYSQRVAFQIWQDGITLRLRSANAPDRPLSLVDSGFSNTVINGQHWRVYSTWDETLSLQIHVAERAEVRNELARGIAANLLLPLLLALPLLAMLLWLAVLRGLHPLTHLTSEVALRAPDNLAALDIRVAPREVAPLISRLNHLFARINTSIENERRFTADAAHELRTPIAAIKAQAQVAQGAMKEGMHDAILHNALDGVILGCDRATHLIEQLLTLARLENVSDTALVSCALRALAAEVMAELASAALTNGVQMDLAESEEVCIQGLPALLKILLRNVIDNAVRHTRTGTLVQVEVFNRNGRPCITICDNGAGLPEEELEKISQRFYRPLGTEASGSGLGLSIVQRIAQIHHAELDFASETAGQGLCVTIRFKACEEPG